MPANLWGTLLHAITMPTSMSCSHSALKARPPYPDVSPTVGSASRWLSARRYSSLYTSPVRTLIHSIQQQNHAPFWTMSCHHQLHVRCLLQIRALSRDVTNIRLRTCQREESIGQREGCCCWHRIARRKGCDGRGLCSTQALVMAGGLLNGTLGSHIFFACLDTSMICSTC